MPFRPSAHVLLTLSGYWTGHRPPVRRGDKLQLRYRRLGSKFPDSESIDGTRLSTPRNALHPEVRALSAGDNLPDPFATRL